MMAARGALWNPSIFSPEGEVSYEVTQKQYIRKVKNFLCSMLTTTKSHILSFIMYLEMNDNLMNRRFLNTDRIVILSSVIFISNLDEWV